MSSNWERLGLTSLGFWDILGKFPSHLQQSFATKPEFYQSGKGLPSYKSTWEANPFADQSVLKGDDSDGCEDRYAHNRGDLAG